MNPALKKVNDIINREIKYLSQFYNYDINNFTDPRFLHASSMIVYRDPGANPDDSLEDRVVNLMAGIEILAIGIKLHNFNIEDFIVLTGKNNPDSNSDRNHVNIEKNYTIDLLFGDVFYSRAVIYILKYGDFNVFNSIVDSLKSVHRTRLTLYQGFVKNSPDYAGKINDLIMENENLITGVNSLLKSSFFIGWGIFADTDEVKLNYETVSDFIFLKALNDISDFFDDLSRRFDYLIGDKFINDKKKSIKNNLKNKIVNLKPRYIKENFQSLQDLYT